METCTSLLNYEMQTEEEVSEGIDALNGERSSSGDGGVEKVISWSQEGQEGLVRLSYITSVSVMTNYT